MRGLWRIVTALCLAATSVASGQGAAKEKPYLVLDAGGHSDSVPNVLFTLDSKQVVTICKDKTARVWDVATGMSERIIRVPIGIGRNGTLYAGSLSRDGKWLALAGIGRRRMIAGYTSFNFRLVKSNAL